MIYYSALSRILFAEDNVERDFENFVKPWDITLAELNALNSLDAFRQPAVKVCNYLQLIVGKLKLIKLFFLIIKFRRPYRVSSAI